MTSRQFLLAAVQATILVVASALAAQTNSPATTQVPDAAQFVGAPRGVALEGQELERRATEIGALLRCPVCQGLSVSDSRAEMAVNMKGQVRDLLARGYTEEQILSYFEQSYGQFVLLKPKFEGLNVLVWLLPILALVAGGVIVFMKARSLESVPRVPAAAAADVPVADPEDPYLAQVRELVGGEKR